MLTNLAQIKGATQLRTDVDSLIKSYAAGKVTTNVVKTPAVIDEETSAVITPAVNYTVEELLAKILSDVNSIQGGGEGGEAMSLSSLADAIKALQDKPIEDYVRLVGNATFADGTFTPAITVTGTHEDEEGNEVPNTIEDIVPQMAEKVYPVYLPDNTVVYDADGHQLTYDFETETFSGVPSVLDVEASKEETATSKVYKALDTDFEFKVFAVGEFTLATLPEKFLLDNAEMQIVAYSNVIDNIIVGLAKDADLLEAIKAAIGTEAVKKALEDGFKSLDSRVDAIEKKTFVETKDIVTTVAATADASDTKVASESAVAKTLDAANAKIAKAVTDLQAEITELRGETVSTVHMEKQLITSTDPVIKFNLEATPNTEMPVEMILGGLSYWEDEDFTVDRDAKTVTWVNTLANGGFDITKDIASTVRFRFYIGVTKTFNSNVITFGNGTQLWVEDITGSDEDETPEVPEAPETTE